MALITWTVVNPMPGAKAGPVGFGTSGSAVNVVRDVGAGQGYAYDGTNWTTFAGPGSAHTDGAGIGAQTDGIVCADDGTSKVCDQWNGAAWSVGGNLANNHTTPGALGLTRSTAVVFAGTGTSNGTTEKYNGAAWSNGNNVPTNNVPYMSGAGSATNGIAAGGNYGAQKTVWKYDGTVWTTLSSLLNKHGLHGYLIGNPDLAHVVNGDQDGMTLIGEDFDGTSWATGNAQNVVRSQSIWGTGSLGGNTAVCAGGYSSVYAPLNSTEEGEGGPPPPPVCWNYTARYCGSSKLFKASGSGSFPKYLQVPGNVDASTGRMVDDGVEIDPDEYRIG